MRRKGLFHSWKMGKQARRVALQLALRAPWSQHSADLAFWSGVREAKVRLLVLMQARGWTDSGAGPIPGMAGCSF